MVLPLSAPQLTVLHTSDWHLGRRLYGRVRYDEFAAFLQWLTQTINTQQVDVLIVAGDVFDTMTPSNQAQALYYEFLGHVSTLCCQHVIIVAGNHDSPTFLDAPSHVLKFLNVHVIGTACEDIKDEVLVLSNKAAQPLCIIAAVPYLRDRDVRSSSAGESAANKDAHVISGIRAHYDAVADIAKRQQKALIKTHQHHVPIIATGHLFAAGGKTTDDDGVRDLYVGSLGQVSADMFDDSFDYVALGHLHVPQRVGGCEHIRYSGSPIAMGFGEAKQQKQVLLIRFNTIKADSPHRYVTKNLAPPIDIHHNAKTKGFMDDLFGFAEALEGQNSEDQNSHRMQVAPLAIPCFQKLAQVTGDIDTISNALQALDQSESVWLEVIYTGDEIVSDLREQIHTLVADLACDNVRTEVLKIKNTRTYNKVLTQDHSTEALQDLGERAVFEHCLNLYSIPDTQKDSLRDAYQKILHDMCQDDRQAK